MSLPLTRRIARAALLVAAGATPVVGAAGSASAMDHSLAPTGALSGLTAVDSASLGNTVDGASQATTDVVGKTGGKSVDKAGKTVGKAGKSATPTAKKVAGEAGEVLGETAGAATESAEAPTGGAVGSLPTGGLMGGLPIGG
ncbi:ATP-binding protein [Streptomyces vilmorinianum]|uniref:ATP-binding protein n=1 Tax=Streptomyces vilmorinianum TaxID=3051092 RepID=UPI0010FB9127|nr:ATP-binding protein [Streptomyces vilmorinianum]